jgi:hypothetical protein
MRFCLIDDKYEKFLVHLPHLGDVRIVGFISTKTWAGGSVSRLVRDIETYLAERNANPKPYKSKAEGAEILSKITRARAALDKAGAA